MDHEKLIDTLLVRIDKGATADELLESSMKTSSADYHREVVQAFGTWERFLTELAITARGMENQQPTGPSRVALEDEERPERSVGAGATRPVTVLTHEGQILNMSLDKLPATRVPELREFPAGPGSFAPHKLVLGIFDTGLALFTNKGNIIVVDRRLLAEHKPGEHVRPLGNRFPGIEEGEGIVDVMPLSYLRNQERYYTVTSLGQIKASNTTELHRISREPSVGFLLKGSDKLIAAFAAPRRSQVYAGGSHAKAIQFSTSDIRSQGRKATGVRAISLGTDEEVVSAFPLRGGKRNIALVTSAGVIKRMPMREFRKQGRGGGGLQSCRLNSGDKVASMAQVSLGGDLLLLTSTGRFARFPAYDLPFGGRAAKGEPLLSLTPGERVQQILGVPAGEFVV